MTEYGKPVFGLVTEKNPVVMTTHGPVMGGTKDGIAIFRGIPYGADVTGEHRFLPASPAENWTEVKDCTKNGPISAQIGTSVWADPVLGTYYGAGHPELFSEVEEANEENSLIVNVLTPGIDSGKRPVMVYIHGGGFNSNSGSIVLGGDRLPREQNVVVISIHHRLGIFGYLYLGAFDSKYALSGNAGMLDLVLALEWVRDNAALFGGDPGNVTLLGESGGGMKINTLMAMECAKGLFHKAIVMSGTRPVDGLSVEEATEMAENFLKNVGVSKDNLSALTTIDTRTLLKAAGGFGQNNYAPVADGIVIPKRGGTIRAWETSRDIPIMVGSSEEEMSLFSPKELLDLKEEDLHELLLKGPQGLAVATKFILPEDKVDHVIEVFRSQPRRQMSADHIYQRMLSFGSMLGGNSWYLAKKRSEAEGFAPVYHYVIRRDTWVPGSPDKKYAWHTAELPWIFRIPTPGDEKMSEVFSRAWAAFARTGSPSTEELPWEPFEMNSRMVMVLDEESHMESDPCRPFREALEDAGIGGK